MQILSPGEYKVVRNGTTPLVSHLGTCVGVTLRDRENGIGGMAHLLLAEPMGQATLSDAPLYVTTGLPLFIDRIQEEGAELENLEAIVAGGALIGPLSDLDINLDIGGRSADAAFRVLDHYGIPVLNSETGGASGCKLVYDPGTLESEITFFHQTLPGNSLEKKSYVRQKQDIEQAIDAINPIPQHVLKLMRTIRSGNYQMRDVAADVKRDQILSARVLHLANSAMYARRNPIASIDTALVLLGERAFMQMILSASLASMFQGEQGGYSLVKGGLYRHALGTAMVAGKIADATGIVEGSIAYTAGLLHDIGKVVLDQFVARRMESFYAAASSRHGNLLAFEEEAAGMNHIEAGMQLASKWGLPPEFRDAIAYHHDPASARENPSLTWIVYLADLLMAHFQYGLEVERMDAAKLEECLQHLGLQPENFESFVAMIPWADFGRMLYSGNRELLDDGNSTA